MSAHTVTADWDWTGGPFLTFKCEAPQDSLCHAVFTCECESWSDAGDDPKVCACGRTVPQPSGLTLTCDWCVDRLGGDR